MSRIYAVSSLTSRRLRAFPVASSLPDGVLDAMVIVRVGKSLRRSCCRFGIVSMLSKMESASRIRLLQPRQSDFSQFWKVNGVPLNSGGGKFFKVLLSGEVFCSYGQHNYSMSTISTSASPRIASDSSDAASALNLKRSLLDESLIKAIAYEGEKGLVNAMGRTTRFGDFLLSQLLVHLASLHRDSSVRSGQLLETLTHLSQNAKKYDTLTYYERFALLNEVSLLLGFEGVIDLIERHASGSEGNEGGVSKEIQSYPVSVSDSHPQDTKDKLHVESDDKLPSTKSWPANHQLSVHPAIKFGSSERIELFTPLRDATAKMKQWDNVKGQDREAEPCQVNEVLPAEEEEKEANRNSTAFSRGSWDAQTSSLNDNQHQNKKPGSAKRSEKSKTTILHDTAVNNDWMLDTPMSFVKCLTKNNRDRLEENGFLTLRMLLHHFPRTYVNYEQAGQKIEDGKHLTFFGEIISARGHRTGSSLGLVEVVVKSIVDQCSTDQDSSDGNFQTGEGDVPVKEESKTAVFLHLKKFFRGSRFTSQWFLNRIVSNYPEGGQAAVSGKVKALNIPGHYEIRDFHLEALEKEELYTPKADIAEDVQSKYSATEKTYSVYPARGNLQPKAIEYYLQRVLPLLPLDLDPLPEALREKFQLMELRQAYIAIHSPTSLEEAKKARHRMVFDEFFYLQTGMLLQKQQLIGKFMDAAGLSSTHFAEQEDDVGAKEKWSALMQRLVESLPYKLTQCQNRVVFEIFCDLRKPVPMNRLLQGDVGCGKTIVAFLALLEVVGAGYQGAFMAPTEFLANQHYSRILSWLELLQEHERPNVALLTGSTTLSKARAIRRGLEAGDIALVVGTHSLISESVKFSALALAVIDEQHRFGVGQRDRFNKSIGIDLTEDINFKKPIDQAYEKKNVKFLGVPHVLMMSATPIPRSLALALHGDMSLSQITERPPGRAPVKTYVFYGDEGGRDAAYKMVDKELENGGQVFIVYPVIEESEELPDLRSAVVEFGKLTTKFEKFKVGLAHGRMKAAEKEEALNHFREGKTQLLISTTVIEVGVDIPEASMIVVEHAERYGMAQLHQLRGRVGRGSRESYCILLSSSLSALDRLKLLELSKDGFYLAEQDLKHRGPGDLLGKRQSGYLPEFSIARLDEDGEVLEQAREAAEEILDQFQNLQDLPKLKRELSMRRAPVSLS